MLTLSRFETVEPWGELIAYRYYFDSAGDSYMSPMLEIYSDWEDGNGDRWSWSLDFGFKSIMSCYDKWMFDSPEAALDDFLYGNDVSFIRDGYVDLIDKVYDEAHTASRKMAEWPTEVKKEEVRFYYPETDEVYFGEAIFNNQYGFTPRVIDLFMSDHDSISLSHNGGGKWDFAYINNGYITNEGECSVISDNWEDVAHSVLDSLDRGISTASRKMAKVVPLDKLEFADMEWLEFTSNPSYVVNIDDNRELIVANMWNSGRWRWEVFDYSLGGAEVYGEQDFDSPDAAFDDAMLNLQGYCFASRKTADRYDQFFNGCYVADLKHWGNSIDDVEFEINAYAYDYTYKVDVWGTGLSNEGYGNSSWEVAEEYGEDIRAVAEKALDGLEFYHVTRDDVINQIVMLAPEIAEQPLELDSQTRERIISDMVEYAIENEMDFNDQYQYYSRAYNTDIDDAKYYLNGLLDSYGFADVGDKDYVVDSIIEDVAWDMIDGKYASNKQATRHFTYAEMQELDDEIEGRELHNANRLRYTTGTELM